MVVFNKCTVCCYTVAPRVNFSEEIIKYFELELELEAYARTCMHTHTHTLSVTNIDRHKQSRAPS